MFLYTFLLAVTLVATAAAQVQFLGVAIAGGDFGCQIDGTCPTGSTQLPLGSNGGGGDGPGQMQHWTSLDKPLNMFRLPVSWQFLVNNQLGGDLDPNNAGKYDQLVQACLSTGAHCMIDIHNFARWNGGIIGQGGPTDDQFVALWTQLATKYADQDRMVFELMNEPHDLDVDVWAATCQKVVAGIRVAGATSQMILLPGTNFDSAATLVSTGSAAALMNVTNLDGTTDNLVLDIHKYLDEDNSGTHKTCTTDNVDAFTTIAEFLRSSGRKGIISETGASSDSTCFTDFCSQNSFINQNSDVFMGLVGWGAGSFDTSYILSLTPSKQNNQLVDNQLMQQCMIAKWVATAGSPPNASSPSSPAAAAPVSPASASQVTVTSVPIVMMTLKPTPTSVPFLAAVGDTTYTMTMSMVTGVGGGEEGEGDGEGLLIASGSPTLPVFPTQVPTGKGTGGLETATRSPNGTVRPPSPSGTGVGGVTASGAQGNVRISIWATVLSLSVGMLFIQ
ncbi:cellulase [Diaporthe helianthi]|uniref:Endoglucanase EG-II n=1 Tax=Diaporthe helianthi TaxID=158607 RepID=A0A2P5I8B5_DIAHE|nr:cellulase [Diaporthe helianthi]